MHDSLGYAAAIATDDIELLDDVTCDWPRRPGSNLQWRQQLRRDCEVGGRAMRLLSSELTSRNS